VKVISLRDVPTKVTFHTDKTLSTPHQRQFVLLFFPSPSTKICVHVIQRSRKDGEKKRKEKLFDLKIHFSPYFYMAVTCQWSRFYASLCYVIYYPVLHTAIHCYEGMGQREIAVNYC